MVKIHGHRPASLRRVISFRVCHVENKRRRIRRVKRAWEIIADNLSKAGWSWGWVSAIDREGRTIWIVDGHGYGERFVVHADEKLTAFLELESAIPVVIPKIAKGTHSGSTNGLAAPGFTLSVLRT
jgi:hypothetical protein